MLNQELPYNSWAERWLLSCIMIEPTLLPECISRKLKWTDFYNKNAQTIYEAILWVYYKNMSITPVTIADELQTMKMLDTCWGLDALYQLNIVEINANSFYDYLDIIVARSKQRQFIREIQKILPMAYDTSSEDVMSKLRVATHWLLNSDLNSNEGWLIWKAYDGLIDTLKNWWLKPICYTWYDILDTYTQGFWETAVWVVWARSRMWKSTLCLNMLMNACKQWVKCCYFTLEINPQEVSAKIMSNVCWIELNELNATWLTDSVIERIKAWEEEARPIKENLYVYNKTRRYDDIVSQIYALSWQWVKLFCLDHLLLVETSSKRQNKANELWDIVNWLKWIAQELNICIILVSQFNRRVDDRIGWEPQISDFNGSSDIENIANVALWIQQIEMIDKDMCDDSDRNTMDIYILKNRSWAVANMRYKCDMSLSRVYNDWYITWWQDAKKKNKKDLQNENKNVKQIQSISEFDYSDYEVESEY